MIPITITHRDLDIDEAAAVEDCLDAASEWDAGRLPLKIALMQGGELSPHRARGMAFRFARHDPRIPALERLSESMSTGNVTIAVTALLMSLSQVPRPTPVLLPM
jgi:hypothetical protein